jgi:hypothetical protein
MHDAVALHIRPVFNDKAQLDAEILFRAFADMLAQRHRRAEHAQFDFRWMDRGCAWQRGAGTGAGGIQSVASAR